MYKINVSSLKSCQYVCYSCGIFTAKIFLKFSLNLRNDAALISEFLSVFEERCPMLLNKIWFWIQFKCFDRIIVWCVELKILKFLGVEGYFIITIIFQIKLVMFRHFLDFNFSLISFFSLTLIKSWRVLYC